MQQINKMSAVAESEELRALSFVRRCVLKKNEKIRELSKKCVKMEEQIQNLKWKCNDLEKENERLSSALTWDDAKHSNGTAMTGSSGVGISEVEENLQFSDTDASTSVKKELGELDFSRVDPAFQTGEIEGSGTDHSASGAIVPSGGSHRKRTIAGDATDPDTLPGASGIGSGNTARKKARMIALRTDPDAGNTTGSGDQLNQSAASEDDYIDDSVQPLDHEDISNHSNANFTATQYLPNASSVVGELLPEGAAEMDPQQIIPGPAVGATKHRRRFAALSGTRDQPALPPDGVVSVQQLDAALVRTPLGTYQCPYCPMEALGECAWRTHVMIHTGEKPFACPECDYASNKKSNVKLHVKSRHPGFRCFECPVGWCRKTYVYAADLAEHAAKCHLDSASTFEAVVE